MPNTVKLEITEAHNPYRTDKFVFETDGSVGKLYAGSSLYPLDEQQVQRILSFAQQTDLAGKLRYHMGLISRDYYVLTFDDATSITSTGEGSSPNVLHLCKCNNSVTAFSTSKRTNLCCYRYKYVL